MTPVESGRPVALVKTAAEGVPRAGVTKVGEVARTIAPLPVVETLGHTPVVVDNFPDTLLQTAPAAFKAVSITPPEPGDNVMFPLEPEKISTLFDGTWFAPILRLQPLAS